MPGTADFAAWSRWNYEWYSLGTSFHTLNTTVQSATSAVYQLSATWAAWNNAWTVSTTSATGLYPLGNSVSSTRLLPLETVESYSDATYWAGWNNQYQVRHGQDRDLEEYRRLREEQLEQHRLRAMERDREREAAELVARGLLMAFLDERQKRDLARNAYFEVIGSSGRRWRIRTGRGYSGNVDLMPEVGDIRIATYCAHGADLMPASDHYLIQKLALEDDDVAFIAVANLHYRNPDVPVQLIPDRRRAA